MFSLPLFPLNTVLFPGLPLRLNIFEPRYKQMIKRCLETGEKFGVVLIKKGREALGPLAEPYLIGCTAQLIQVETTPDERYDITAIGRERFRILSLDRVSYPYLAGMVEIYPYMGPDQTLVQSIAQPLRDWVKRYFEALSEATHSEMDARYIPNDPMGLAFLATYLLQIPPAEKQKILEIEHTDQMLEAVIELYRREVVFIKRLVKDEGKSQRGFYLN
ncbi:MAG: LON peptidase substrate-binding domain-containing protein [Anaerolineales bacterium]